MIGDLILLSGNDIPFPEAKVIVHQPTLKEIAYIGEEAFFVGCGFLDFSKDLLPTEDKNKLTNIDDFDIFMTIVTNRNKETKQTIDCAFLVLSLIFPLYKIEVRKDAIVLKEANNEEHVINRDNFSALKEIVKTIFNLNLGKDKSEQYNPSGDMAKRIAEKFKKRHEKLMQLANEKDKNTKRISILSRYASILAVGLQKDLKSLMNYTVCQLYDEFQRFQLKVQWDAYIQARIAGAKDLDEVDNWMIDLRDQGKNLNKNKK